jgi:hypothetical protein
MPALMDFGHPRRSRLPSSPILAIIGANVGHAD